MNNTILIVDDEDSICDVVAEWFEDEGYQVLCAATGRAMQAMLAQRMPHLILLDVSLPDADGCALAAELARDPATQHIPIILMSGHPEETLTSVGTPHVFLAKPFDLSAALALVQACLSAARQPPLRDNAVGDYSP